MKSSFFLENCQTCPCISRENTLRVARSSLLFLLLALQPCFGQVEKSTAETGEDLFMRNKPDQAVPYLEKALLENPADGKLYEYLGICYQQLGRHDDAINVMKRGVAASVSNGDRLYLNIGNNYFVQNKFSFAEEMYTNAVSRNRTLSAAYLNRALARIRLEKYGDAVSDYNLYLTLEPGSVQKGKILEHIGILNTILYEEQRKKDEEERLRRELEAREKALLNEVLNSLKTSSEDTKNLSAQSEGLQEYEDDLDIED